MSDLSEAGAGLLAASEEEQAAAVDAYVSAGLAKIESVVGGLSVIKPDVLLAAMDTLLRHLLSDHPANYLPLREHQAEAYTGAVEPEKASDPLSDAITRQSPKIEGEPQLAETVDAADHPLNTNADTAQ